MTITHLKVSGVADGGDTTVVRPSDWNADHTILLGLTLPQNETPSTPATDNLGLFTRKLGGRMMPGSIGPSGLDTLMQPNIGRDKLWYVTANGDTAVLTYIGANALTAVGTATLRAWASTNLCTSMRGVNYLVTVAAVGAVAGFRGAAQQWQIGDSTDPNIGGFYFICRWAPATGTTVATQRMFCGMRSLIAAPTDVNPSTYVNLMGMGCDNGDTNLQFMTNDATGTATRTDLGASFPRPTADSVKVYEVSMFIKPNGTTLYWQVSELSAGVTASGSSSSDLPVNTLGLAPLCYHSVGGTSSVVGVTLYSLYIDTDF